MCPHSIAVSFLPPLFESIQTIGKVKRRLIRVKYRVIYILKHNKKNNKENKENKEDEEEEEEEEEKKKSLQ